MRPYHANGVQNSFFLKKVGQSRPLFHLFSVFFKQTLQFLQQIYVKKCPSSILCRDSNPQPSERESLPITTRPGLLPCTKFLLWIGIFQLKADLVDAALVLSVILLVVSSNWHLHIKCSKSFYHQSCTEIYRFLCCMILGPIK